MTQPTAKQVNRVLRSKRCGPHENKKRKKRKKEESEFMKQVREAIKRSRQQMDDLQ